MSILRWIARQAWSTWCWIGLVGNTLIRYWIGRLRSPWIGPRDAFGRAVQGWGRFNMRRGLHVCEVEPHPPLPSPAILISNHKHYFDICLIASIVPPPLYFVARLEVERLPVIGSILRRGGHVFVRRGRGSENDDALDDAVAGFREGGRLVVFAEGTRSRTGEILRLRSGGLRLAARTGVPIVPLVIAGTRGVFPSGLWPIIPTRMAVAFLPPRVVDETQARSTAYREALRAEMQATLDRLTPRTGPRFWDAMYKH